MTPEIASWKSVNEVAFERKRHRMTVYQWCWSGRALTRQEPGGGWLIACDAFGLPLPGPNFGKSKKRGRKGVRCAN